MPILKIFIDDEETEFKIIPLNKHIYDVIIMKYCNRDGVIDRPGFLSYIVKEPKMSRKEWGEVPSSMITKILRNVQHYIESIFLKEMELRKIYTQINVFEDEIDDLYRYLGEDSDDWAWNRIKRMQKTVDELTEKSKSIEDSLEYVKSDMVVFEEGVEINYDVQPLQLEHKK